MMSKPQVIRPPQLSDRTINSELINYHCSLVAAAVRDLYHYYIYPKIWIPKTTIDTIIYDIKAYMLLFVIYIAGLCTIVNIIVFMYIACMCHWIIHTFTIHGHNGTHTAMHFLMYVYMQHILF